MPEINFIKIGNINLPQGRSRSVDDFSFATIPGTGAAAGFVFFPKDTESNLLEWSIELRFVNGSDKNIIINGIGCNFYGQNGFRSKSRRFVEVFNVKDNLECHLPLLIQANSEKEYRFRFTLEIFRRVFFSFEKRMFFNKSEIVEPQTYQTLIQTIDISMELQNFKNPLFLRF